MGASSISSRAACVAFVALALTTTFACRFSVPPACEAGFLDCDHDTSTGTNGCEVNIKTDAKHCDGCNRACGVGESCCDGTCKAICSPTCNQPLADCNKNPSDGCEVDTSSDPAHCGGCEQSCNGPNVVSATCSGGACKRSCAVGYADCTTEPGCETTLGTTSACRSCAEKCATNAVCTANGCECPAGETLCSGTCVDTKIDEVNCGSCAKPCKLNAVCESSACSCPAGQDCSCNRPSYDGVCVVKPQCGCSGGQACVLSGGKSGCQTAGTGAPYAACTGGGTGCVVGSFCGASGLCKPYCAVDGDCGVGSVAGRCQPTTTTGARFCVSPACDPVNPSSTAGGNTPCPTNHHCAPGVGTSSAPTDCLGAIGNGNHNATCNSSADCVAGHVCSIGPKKCAKYCYTTSDCPSGKTCSSFNLNYKAGAKAVGLCTL